MKRLMWVYFCTLLLLTACSENNEIQELEAETSQIEDKKRTTPQPLLKFPPATQRTTTGGFTECNPDIFNVEGGLAWEYACYDPTLGYNPATTVMNQYFNSCVGLIPQSPDQECTVESTYFVYEENRVVTDCPALTPFTFLEFNSTCYPCPNPQAANYDISPVELQAFSDFILGQAQNSVPAGFELMKVEALYTEWFECTHLQKYFECELRDPQPANIVGCNQGYLDEHCDSACRSCESRRVVFEISYIRCITEPTLPNPGKCSMTVKLVNSDGDWRVRVSKLNDGNTESYVGTICSDPAACDYPITAIGGSVNLPLSHQECMTYNFYSYDGDIELEITTPAGTTTIFIEAQTTKSINLSCSPIMCPPPDCHMTVELLDANGASDWLINVMRVEFTGAESLGAICSNGSPVSCDFPLNNIGDSVTIPLTEFCREYIFNSLLGEVTLRITTPGEVIVLTTSSANPHLAIFLSCMDVPCP